MRAVVKCRDGTGANSESSSEFRLRVTRSFKLSRVLEQGAGYWMNGIRGTLRQVSNVPFR